MKKVLALILAVVMCFGMASVAFGIDVTLPILGAGTFGEDGWDIGMEGEDAFWLNGGIQYVAGSEFYVIPVVEDPDTGEVTPFVITDAEVTQGSTTVYEPAFFFDDDGNMPTDTWLVQMKTQDIAAVKDYDMVLHIEGTYTTAAGVDYNVEGDIVLTVKDTGVIDENDINKARIDGDFEVATEGRYVVSADAFAAIKSGETFKFPSNGYALNVGAGISNALNFRASIEKIDAIVERYGEDKVLGVIDFKDKNELPVEIGVEMECTEYSSTHVTNQAYVYRIEGDKLVLITDKAEYDAARDVVSFSTNKLGTLVISAEPLTDAADAPATTTESKDNPGTGANDVIGLAVAGAVVAMAAGFVALKK